MKSLIVTVARVRAELVRAGLYHKTSHLGGTKVYDCGDAVLINPASGLFNLARGRRVKIMIELRRRGYKCAEDDQLAQGGVKVPYSQE